MLTVTNEDVLPAYLQRVSDFEDCLLATCTKENQCDAIVTRNKKAARNNADIILFKGLGHSLSKVSSPLKDEGGTIEDEVIVRVVEWLKKNVE